MSSYWNALGAQEKGTAFRQAVAEMVVSTEPARFQAALGALARVGVNYCAPYLLVHELADAANAIKIHSQRADSQTGPLLENNQFNVN